MAEISNQNEGTSNDNNRSRKKRKLAVDENVLSTKIANTFSSKANELLYSNKKGADVHFVFKASDERVPAHKAILAVLSPVFDAEFFGPLAENDEVKINDACAGAFNEFLQFFYLQEVTLSMEFIQNVMYLCEKYQINECVRTCATFLKENLTFDEIWLGYELALRYNQNDLKEFCLHQTTTSNENILQSDGFLSCNWNTLDDFITNSKSISRESDYLKACIDWAKNACQRNGMDVNIREDIRSQLKDTIYKIRFIQITLPEFVTHLKKNPCNPYTEDEMNDIIYIMADENITSTKFNCLPRLASFFWNDEKIIRCSRVSPNLTKLSKRSIIPNTMSTVFSSDRSLIFGEFLMAVSSTELNICCEISVENLDSETKVIDKFTQELVPKDGIIRSMISLPTPIFIAKNIKYKITSDFSPFQMKSTYSHLNRNVKLKNDAVITFHRDTSSDLGVDKGIIVTMNFNEYNNK